MQISPVASFAAADLQQSGPWLDAAMGGIVRISRDDESFLLLRESQLDSLVASEGRPDSLQALLAGYDAADIKARLATWTTEPAAGNEAL